MDRLALAALVRLEPQQQHDRREGHNEGPRGDTDDGRVGVGLQAEERRDAVEYLRRYGDGKRPTRALSQASGAGQGKEPDDGDGDYGGDWGFGRVVMVRRDHERDRCQVANAEDAEQYDRGLDSGLHPMLLTRVGEVIVSRGPGQRVRQRTESCEIASVSGGRAGRVRRGRRGRPGGAAAARNAYWDASTRAVSPWRGSPASTAP